MRRKLMATGAIVALLLFPTGCGLPAAAHSAGPGPGSGTALSSELVDAALVTPTFGWVLTEDQVLLTSDGGRTLHPAQVDLPRGYLRTAHFQDATHGWVAATDQHEIVVARTADGGAHWQNSSITPSATVGRLSVGFGDLNSGALMAQLQTGPSFSSAFMFTSTDGGASWAAGTAPAAGRVTVEPGGRIWLAGGVLGNRLYVSADHAETWARPTLATSDQSTVDGVTPPTDGVLAARISDASGSRAVLFSTTDGGSTWLEASSIPVAAGGSGPPPFTVRDGTATLLDQGGGRMLQIGTLAGAVRNAHAAPRAIAGMPDGVTHISFGNDSVGWALAGSGSCHKGKQDCSYTTTLAATTDSGTSWTTILSWVEPIK
jgi:hypothetical protein